eukprot:632649-Amphidinium_carterae.1
MQHRRGYKAMFLNPKHDNHITTTVGEDIACAMSSKVHTTIPILHFAACCKLFHLALSILVPAIYSGDALTQHLEHSQLHDGTNTTGVACRPALKVKH